MSYELKACRDHWQFLAPHVKERRTAQHLRQAIGIAERSEAKLKIAVEALEKIGSITLLHSSSYAKQVSDDCLEAIAKINFNKPNTT